MKRCNTCKIEKPKTEFHSSGFYIRKNGTKTLVVKPDCKQCHLTKQRNWFYSLWAKKFKFECSRCGYNKCKAALELHHTVSAEKEFSLSSRHSISAKLFEKEANKCIVLCSNCHREEHNKYLGTQ